MKPNVKFLLFLLVFVFGVIVGTVSWSIYESIPKKLTNHAEIRMINVDIFADESLTMILTHIDWGFIDPGENVTFPSWIKNTGNDAQKLITWTEEWNPMNASDYITLTWNYDGSWIPVNDSIPVVFTLHVVPDFDPDITGFTEFSFVIWVKGVH